MSYSKTTVTERRAERDRLFDELIGERWEKRWYRRSIGDQPPIKVVQVLVTGVGTWVFWVYAQDGQPFTTRQPRRRITLEMFRRLYTRGMDVS